jgi:hypothetical protein
MSWNAAAIASLSSVAAVARPATLVAARMVTMGVEDLLDQRMRTEQGGCWEIGHATRMLAVPRCDPTSALLELSGMSGQPPKVCVQYSLPEELRATATPVSLNAQFSMLARCARLVDQKLTACWALWN